MLMMDTAPPATSTVIIDTAQHSPGGMQMTDADLDAKAAALDARTSVWLVDGKIRPLHRPSRTMPPQRSPR
jgi:hypothetical protein